MNRVCRFAYPTVRRLADFDGEPTHISCGLSDKALPTAHVETRLISCRSAYPIGLGALWWETCQIHYVRKALRTVNATIHGSIVDCVYFSKGQSAVKFLGAVEHEDGTKVFKPPATGNAPSCKQYTEVCNREQPPREPWTIICETESDRIAELAFQARPVHVMWEQLGLPRRALDLVAAFADEPHCNPTSFSDDPSDRLADIVIDNGGCRVTGMGGVGKTTLAKRIVQRLSVREPDTRVTTCAVTHTASRLLPGGRTLAHILRKDVKGTNLTKRVFIVDEASLVSQAAWARLGEFLMMGARFILLGDWDGQLPPVQESWLGDTAARYTDILRQLSRALEIQLVVSRRASGDPEFVEHIRSLYDHVDEPDELRVDLVRMRGMYPCDGEDPGLTLTISHLKRRRVNAYYTNLLDRKQPGAILLQPSRAVPGANQPQPFYIYVGQEVQACVARSGVVLNGVIYRVVSLEGGVTLDMMPEYCSAKTDMHDRPLPLAELLRLKKLEEGVRLNFEDAAHFLRPTHALCYAGIMGRTIRRSILLLDTSHRFFTARHLIVGMGRATHGSDMSIATDEQERELLSRMSAVKHLDPTAPEPDSDDSEDEEW
jgi:hypothetical protein